MQNVRMTEGNPLKLIFLFSLPLMVGNIFQQLYTVVDTAIVGQTLGVNALAALGASDWISWLAFGVLTGFPQGFSILIAQAFGANDEDLVNKRLVSLTQCSIMVAIVFVTIGYICLLPLLRVLQTPYEIIQQSYQYLQIIYLGLPITMLYNACASVLRAFGNSKTPLRAMIIAAIVNVFLDYICILYLQLGVQGAAIATIIAQFVAGMICLHTLRKNPIIHSFSLGSFDGKSYYEMLKVGTPMAFQNILIAIGGMILTGVVNGYGTLFIAGFTAVNKLYGLLEIAAVSYGYAMVSYVGQNFGAQLYERIKKGLRSAVLLGTLTAIVITIIIQIFDQQILLLFIAGEPYEVEQVLRVGENFLFWMSLSLFILYWLHIYRSTLQGLSNTWIPMVSGFVELACRITAALYLPTLLQEGGLYFVEPIAWIGATVLLISWYYKTIRSWNITK